MWDMETETEARGWGWGDGESLPSESAAPRVMSEDATSTRSREVNAGCAPVQATHRWSRLLSLARAQLRRLALAWPPHVARSKQFSAIPCRCMKLGCFA